MSKKLKIIVTSGGTREYIDDVRVLTNISTGKLGAKIAEEFIEHGHDVIYVSPKSSVKPEEGDYEHRKVTDVDSLAKVMEEIVPEADAVIHSMAVSDFGFNHDKPVKLSSSSKEDFIEYMRANIKYNPKVISFLKSWNPKAVLVGFKFTVGETSANLKKIALEMKAKNNLDMVFANDKIAMSKASEHVGVLLMNEWEEKVHGKKEIATTIYDNVIRVINGRK